MSYIVKLHFTSGDKTYSVLREGFGPGDQVGAKGRHATQSCRLRIRSAEAPALFLQETALFIDAAFCERSGGTDTVLFEGVVRPYQTVSAKNATEDNFSFEIMDYTEILKIKSFESENFTDKTLGWVVSHIYSLADLDPDLSYPAEMENITLAFPILDADKYGNIADLLSAILFEFGYDYKFTPGTCNIFKTYLSSSSGLSVASIKNQLKVQRDDNWTDGVRVKYGVAGICRQVPIANWKEDISDLQWWRYTLPWSYSTSSGHVTRTVPYDLSGWSKKPAELKEEHILYASNLNVPHDPYCTILSLTAQARSIAVEFSWDKTVNYLWGNVTGGQMPNITVYGDIVYAIPGDYEEQISGEKPDEFTLVFCQNTDLAKAFAEREYKRAKVAPLTYSFQSLTHYAAGSFVRLTDTVIGINVPVRILSCNKDANNIYSIKAESADYLGMSVTVQDLQMRDVIELGSGLQLTASTSSVVEGENVTVTASGSILDVLDNTGSTGYSFRWSLNGNDKPAWDNLKTITVSSEDLEAGNDTFRFSVIYSSGGTSTEIVYAEAEVFRSVGMAVMETKEQYYISTSPTEMTGGEWMDVLISHTSGYVWRRLKYSYSNGDVIYGEPFCTLEPAGAITVSIQEYALSLSESSFIYPDASLGYTAASYGAIENSESFEYGFNDNIWSSDTLNWYKGLYVWQRTKITASDGSVTYTDPVYAKTITESLLQACSLSVSSNPKTFDINSRKPGYQYIPVIVRSIGYKGTMVLNTDIGVFCTYDSGTDTYTAVGDHIEGLSVVNPTDLDNYYLRLPYTLSPTAEAGITAVLTEWDSTIAAPHVVTAHSVLSGTEAKNVVVQLATVATENDLPTSLNFTDSAQDDIVTGNNLIYGDYILVRSVGGVFRPTPYMWNGAAWVSADSSIKPYVKVNTVNESISLAKAQHEIDPTIDYHDVLYAYEGYIANLTVGILYVGDVFANNIESNNYSEDGSGTPVTGYKLEHQGGDNHDGLIKSVGGVFKDMKVRGNMDLRKADGTSGANILHPALTTVDGMPGDPTGKTLDAPTKWTFKELYEGISSQNQVLNAGSGSNVNGTEVSKVVKLTNPDSTMSAAETGSSVELGNGNTFTVFQPTHGGTVTISGTAPYRLQNSYDLSYKSCALTFKQGSTVLATVAEKSWRGGGSYDVSFTVTFNISGGGIIKCTTSSVSGSASTVNGHCTGSVSAQSFRDAGLTQTGLWLRMYQGSSHPAAWFRKDTTTMYSTSEYYEITVESHLYESSDYVNMALMVKFVEYASYTWTDSGGVSHSQAIDTGKTYRLDSTLTTAVLNGVTTRSATFFRRDSSTVATLIFSDGSSVSFSSTDYLRMTGRIAIGGCENGVEMMGQYPKTDQTYDIGTPDKRWLTGYISNLPLTSKRSEKKDIEPLDRPALEILKDVAIVRFKFKNDKRGTPLIGFIADDTDADLSGVGHDSMMVNSCIGVLIKAVQELQAEIEQLRGGRA